jgi:hypothetical protein
MVRFAHLVRLALAAWVARWAAMEVASRLGHRGGGSSKG